MNLDKVIRSFLIRPAWGFALGLIVAGTVLVETLPASVIVQDAIERARDELDQIQERLESLRTRADTQRREKLDTLRELESRLEETESRFEDLRLEESSLDTEIRELEASRQERETILDDVESRLEKSALESADRLEGSLVGLEHPDWIESFRSLSEPDDALPDRVREYLTLSCREIAASSVASRFRASILLPNGEMAPSDLIRIGLVEGYFDRGDAIGGVYPSSEGNRFRGVTFERSDHREAIRDLFERTSAPSAPSGEARAPIDPSGGLAAYRDLSSRSVKESFEAGGLIMYPLAALALLAVILFVERLFYLIIAGRQVRRVVEPVRELCVDGKHREASGWLEKQRGPAARVLSSCLALREAPPEVVDRGVEEAMLAEIPRIERALGTLGTLGAIAPFLGLLGTITGMIKTFNVITASGGNDPSLLSGGISEALLTTQAGLIVAIPILLLHTLLSGRVDSLIARIEQGIAGVTATFVGDREENQANDRAPESSKPESAEDEEG